ncbi:MAG: hypothetical protein IKQ35_03495 [Bacilli bacterium]|nr:hypothetical protein [Bacilli bacterium]
MEDERKEGFLRRTEAVTTVRAGSVKPNKAKLTGKTIVGLRASDAALAHRIERYNEEYNRLVAIATEISEKQEDEVRTEEVRTDIERFNRQAEKLAQLSVSIFAFDDLENKISLNGVGVKAIRVPGRLTRLLNGFTKAGIEKNEKYAKVESAIEDVAKSVISENPDELTVDITKLEGLSVVTPGETLETTNLEEAPVVDTVNAKLGEVYDLGSLLSDEELAERKAKYLTSFTDLILGKEPETGVDAFASLILGNTSHETKKESTSAETAENAEPIVVEPIVFGTEPTEALIEIITAAPTLFDAMHSIYEEGYRLKKVNREKNTYPDFIKDNQKICVVHKGAYIDASAYPGLVSLLLLASKWGKNGTYDESERVVFEKALAGYEVSNEELSTLGFTELSDQVAYLKDSKHKAKAIGCYEEISGNEVVLYKEETVEEVTEESSELQESRDSLVNTLKQILGEKQTAEAVEETTTEASEHQAEEVAAVQEETTEPDINSVYKALLEAGLKYDQTTGKLVRIDEPMEEQVTNPLTDYVIDYVPEETTETQDAEVAEGFDLNKWDATVKDVLSYEDEDLSGDEPYDREQERISKMFGDDETALRFLTEEIKDPATGEAKFTLEDIQTACQTEKITPLALMVDIFGRMPQEKKVEVLNRYTTTGSVLSNPNPVVETASVAEGIVR